MDGPLLPARDEGQTKEEDLSVDDGIDFGAGSPAVTNEAWTSTDTEDLDDNDDDTAQDKSAIHPSPLDITSWYQKVVNSEPLADPPPSLIPTPFEEGVIGGMSVNDILMVRGQINPLVYIQFTCLTSFHHEAASRIPCVEMSLFLNGHNTASPRPTTDRTGSAVSGSTIVYHES